MTGTGAACFDGKVSEGDARERGREGPGERLGCVEVESHDVPKVLFK